MDDSRTTPTDPSPLATETEGVAASHPLPAASVSGDFSLHVGDMLEVLQQYPDDYFDLTFTSPPYEAKRGYGIDFNLKGEQWVEWCKVRYLECLRVTKGLVAWVLNSSTQNYRSSTTPLLLFADLHRAGVNLRKPPIFHRVGIPGSGGPDWLRDDYEFIVAATKGGRLPWSDNTAMGHPPIYAPGGPPSHRTRGARGQEDGRVSGNYKPPDLANPGNVIKCAVGFGNMGSVLCHENEAPFPEALAEFFVRSFCPPNGRVLDPFGGSGTTLAVALRLGRNAVNIDIRDSQVELAKQRIAEGQTQ